MRSACAPAFRLYPRLDDIQKERKELMGKLSSLHVSLLSYKYACAPSVLPERDSFSETLEILNTRVLKLLSQVKERLYTTVCVLGRSGSGKTHLLNTILSEGLAIPRNLEIPLDKDIIKSCLKVSFIDVRGEHVCWTPQMAELGNANGAAAEKFQHFFPEITSSEECSRILPEGDMLCTTKVPVHLFYGDCVKVSFAYTSATRVENDLKSLLTLRNCCSSKRPTDFYGAQQASKDACGGETTDESLTGVGGNVSRAFAVLGLAPGFDITALADEDIRLPEHLVACIGRIFTCSLTGCPLREALAYLKAVLFDLLCGENSHSGLLNFVSIEVPSTNLSHEMELVDLPGFGDAMFSGSSNVSSVVERASRLIHVCDERKLDGDVTRFLMKTFLRRMIRDECRFVSVCNNRHRKRCRKRNDEIWHKARCEEFINLALSVHGKPNVDVDEYVRHHCRFCVLYSGSSQIFATLECIKFVLAPTSPDGLVAGVELERTRFDDIKRLLACHVFCVASYAKASTFPYCKSSRSLYDDKISRTGVKTEGLTSLVHHFEGLLNYFVREKCALFYSSVRSRIQDTIHDDTFSEYINWTGVQFRWPNKLPRQHKLYCSAIRAMEAFVFVTLYGSQDKCATQDELRFCIEQAIENYKKIGARSHYNIRDEQSSHVLLLKLLVTLDSLIDKFLRTKMDVLYELSNTFRELTKHVSCDDEHMYSNFNELALEATVRIVTRRCKHCVQQIVSDMWLIVKRFRKGVMETESFEDTRRSLFHNNVFIWGALVLQETVHRNDSFYLSRIQDVGALSFKHLMTEILLALATICLSRRLRPYICTSLSKNDVRAIYHSVSQMMISTGRSTLSMHSLYSIITSMRTIYGGSVRDFCFALETLGCHENPYQLESNVLDSKALDLQLCLTELERNPNDIPRLTERSVIIHESLQYLEREVLTCDTFFREWGSDILVSFVFFYLNAHGRIREYCFEAAHRIAGRWLKLHQTFDQPLYREDILFLNEAVYAMKTLEIDVKHLEDALSSVASKWHLNEYIGLTQAASLTYDMLNSAMIWAFFFRGTGIEVGGISEKEIDEMSNAAVKSLECEVQADSMRSFQDKCYFVTHRIFTHTSWCSSKIDIEFYNKERRFLRYYLPYLQRAQDIELVGEFVQTLKCFGYSETDSNIDKAVQFLLSYRDDSVRLLFQLTPI